LDIFEMIASISEPTQANQQRSLWIDSFSFLGNIKLMSKTSNVFFIDGRTLNYVL
jgi:hypothetical protein